MISTQPSQPRQTPNIDQQMMKRALVQARIAFHRGEVPVGAVLAVNDEVVCQSHNAVEARQDMTAHAEMICLQEAASSLGKWRIGGTLYVTLEPCPMCAGAILQGRVHRLVYGARNARLGAHGSWIDLLSTHPSQTGGRDVKQNGTASDVDCGECQTEKCSRSRLDGQLHPFHRGLEVFSGVCEEESSELLRLFFKRRRLQTQQNRRIHLCWKQLNHVGHI